MKVKHRSGLTISYLPNMFERECHNGMVDPRLSNVSRLLRFPGFGIRGSNISSRGSTINKRGKNGGKFLTLKIKYYLSII